MVDLLEKSLGQLPSGLQHVSAPAEHEAPASRLEVENRPKKQTAFALGFPAPPATSPENPAYDTLQQILSGMGGRLFLNLRSKKALAYTVHASTISALYGGAFVTYIAGDATKEAHALEGMWEELEELKRNQVSAQELENARNALAGYYTLNTQTASTRVLDYANCYLLGRPLPYAATYRELVRNVTADDLMQIASKTFRETHSTIGIVRGTTETTEAEKIIGVS
jgi:zinc protease